LAVGFSRAAVLDRGLGLRCRHYLVSGSKLSKFRERASLQRLNAEAFRSCSGASP